MFVIYFERIIKTLEIFGGKYKVFKTVFGE